MKKRVQYIIGGSTAALVTAGLVWLGGNNRFDVLNAQGPVAAQQRDLMLIVVLLMLVVVIPVFVFTFHIAWKYRAGNSKAAYTPDWDSNRKLEAIWWSIPSAIILVLGIIIWNSSHSLDPYRPIASTQTPVRVQVVALQWKWLFIYPELGVASVNHLQVPVGTPINFEITADAPMNSFWIPQLGGQVYAMSGMATKLHLVADKPGNYQGSSANLSGEGFANMRFVTAASSTQEFDDWVTAVRNNPSQVEVLDLPLYRQLAQPGEGKEVNFVVNDGQLFDKVIQKYTQPPETERHGPEHVQEHQPSTHSGH